MLLSLLVLPFPLWCLFWPGIRHKERWDSSDIVWFHHILGARWLGSVLGCETTEKDSTEEDQVNHVYFSLALKVHCWGCHKSATSQHFAYTLDRSTHNHIFSVGYVLFLTCISRFFKIASLLCGTVLETSLQQLTLEVAGILLKGEHFLGHRPALKIKSRSKYCHIN